MKSILFILVLTLISMYAVFRPVFHAKTTIIHPIKADPPGRESRPMPYPVDVLNSDAPMRMKDPLCHVGYGIS